MIKLNKIDKFIKNNIRSFRAKAIPLILDDKSIAVGNSLIKRLSSAVILNDPRNDVILKLNFVYSAVLLAKYIDTGSTPNSKIWNNIVDLDRKLGKYRAEQVFYENKLKKQIRWQSDRDTADSKLVSKYELRLVACLKNWCAYNAEDSIRTALINADLPDISDNVPRRMKITNAGITPKKSIIDSISVLGEESPKPKQFDKNLIFVAIDFDLQFENNYF